MRCFIAIELDEIIKSRIELLQGQLRRQLRGQDKGIKWVKSDNIHLTLKFLGDIEDKLIPEICRAIDNAIAKCPPFDFEITTLGCFPEQGPARVLWLGMDCPEIKKLQQNIEEHMKKLGIAPENKFQPHLTLARIKNSETGQSIRDLIEEEISIDIGLQDVRQIYLIQSQSEKDGPVYATMHKAALANE